MDRLIRIVCCGDQADAVLYALFDHLRQLPKDRIRLSEIATVNVESPVFELSLCNDCFNGKIRSFCSDFVWLNFQFLCISAEWFADIAKNAKSDSVKRGKLLQIIRDCDYFLYCSDDAIDIESRSLVIDGLTHYMRDARCLQSPRPILFIHKTLQPVSDTAAVWFDASHAALKENYEQTYAGRIGVKLPFDSQLVSRELNHFLLSSTSGSGVTRLFFQRIGAFEDTRNPSWRDVLKEVLTKIWQFITWSPKEVSLCDSCPFKETNNG